MQEFEFTEGSIDRINRNIVECKSNHVCPKFPLGNKELIETLWNVNSK